MVRGAQRTAIHSRQRRPLKIGAAWGGGLRIYNLGRVDLLASDVID
jgi:hypothetical protein